MRNWVRIAIGAYLDQFTAHLLDDCFAELNKKKKKVEVNG